MNAIILALYITASTPALVAALVAAEAVAEVRYYRRGYQSGIETANAVLARAIGVGCLLALSVGWWWLILRTLP